MIALVPGLMTIALRTKPSPFPEFFFCPFFSQYLTLFLPSVSSHNLFFPFPSHFSCLFYTHSLLPFSSLPLSIVLLSHIFFPFLFFSFSCLFILPFPFSSFLFVPYLPSSSQTLRIRLSLTHRQTDQVKPSTSTSNQPSPDCPD